MRQNARLTARVKGAIVVGTLVLHPVLLYLMLPVLGEPANFVGTLAPIVATMLFSWRMGLAAMLVNVVVSARMFMSVTMMGAGEGTPKAIVSALVIAVACFGAERLRRYIEQRRAMEEEFNQAKKMEAVGRLAGGVAHDINNTLNSIMASVFAHRQEIAQDHRQFQDLDNIVSACERGSQLTRNLLGFARKSNYNRQVVSVDAVVERVHAILKRTANKNIQINSNLEAGSPAIWGNRAQIESAVMNLCLNALDAMADGGSLTLATAKEGNHVRIVVEDTGVGMDESTKERVFEPFFTTKAEGKGTGLGLAMVYGFVHSLSGRIVLNTAPGKGTSVTLVFPAATASPSTTAPEAECRVSTNPKYLSGRTVLLIDDEPLVLRASTRMLRALGCDVLSAGSGPAGTAMFRERSDAVDLVIVDLIMPEMDGFAVIEQLYAIRPSVPVILASGYPREPDRLESMKEKHRALRFLQKPYQPEELINASRELFTLEDSAVAKVEADPMAASPVVPVKDGNRVSR